MASAGALPIRLSRRGFLLLCAAGVLVAALFALVPVSVHFADDPLLRLRRLDPQLSPPGPTADCGSPASNLSVEPPTTDLFDVARANACQHAARRRVSAGLAAAVICVVIGLLGLHGASQAESARANKPAPRPSARASRGPSDTLGLGLGVRHEHGREG